MSEVKSIKSCKKKHHIEKEESDEEFVRSFIEGFEDILEGRITEWKPKH